MKNLFEFFTNPISIFKNIMEIIFYFTFYFQNNKNYFIFYLLLTYFYAKS
jgi:hypothetical protein